MRTALLVLLPSLALVVAGCSYTLKPDATAQTVTTSIKEQTGFEAKDMKCPDGVEAKVDVTFECTFTGPEGPYTAYVRITKADGEDASFYIESKRNG